MADIYPNVIGYHTNDETRCKDFLENATPINSHDIDWLGYGMYFWDNISNAKYWLGEKIRKARRKTSRNIPNFVIVQANIFIDKLLDLTDKETDEKIQLIWLEYCKKTRTVEDQPLGKKLDILFSHPELKFNDKHFVIKVSGVYNRNEVPRLLKGSRMDTKRRTIYNVKNEEAIFNCKKFEESA